ncbi:MAG: hypothetical protein KDE04_14810, partial [Anaerolineales bacterium]|nr:hypothetical protein [Anaerolineales bacterium]
MRRKLISRHIFALVIVLLLLAGCDGLGPDPTPVKVSPAVTATTAPAPSPTQGPVQLGGDPVPVPATPTPRPTRQPAPTATYDPGLAEWTIFVYMDADNDLEPASLLDFNEMEAVQGLPAINVLVQLDRRADAGDGPDDWSTARRYRVLPDNDPETINSEMLQDLGEVNMGDPAQLSSFLSWGV